MCGHSPAVPPLLSDLWCGCWRVCCALGTKVPAGSTSRGPLCVASPCPGLKWPAPLCVLRPRSCCSLQTWEQSVGTGARQLLSGVGLRCPPRGSARVRTGGPAVCAGPGAVNGAQLPLPPGHCGGYRVGSPLSRRCPGVLLNGDISVPPRVPGPAFTSCPQAQPILGAQPTGLRRPSLPPCWSPVVRPPLCTPRPPAGTGPRLFGLLIKPAQAPPELGLGGCRWGQGVVPGLGQCCPPGPPSSAFCHQSLASGRRRCAEPSGCQRWGGRRPPSGPRAWWAPGQVPPALCGRGCLHGRASGPGAIAITASAC